MPQSGVCHAPSNMCVASGTSVPGVFPRELQDPGPTGKVNSWCSEPARPPPWGAPQCSFRVGAPSGQRLPRLEGQGRYVTSTARTGPHRCPPGPGRLAASASSAGGGLFAPAEHLAGPALAVCPRTRKCTRQGREAPSETEGRAAATLRVTTRWTESGLKCASSLKDTEKQILQRLCPAANFISDFYAKTLSPHVPREVTWNPG